MTDPRTQASVPLAEDPSSDLRPLLSRARSLPIPAGAKERIWRQLSSPHARLVDDPAEDVVLVDLLRQAASREPSDQTREIIWQRMTEEAAARAGLAEPRRLMETDDAAAALLAHEASLEPPYARQARLYRTLSPQRPTAWSLRFALAGGALAACVLLLLPVLKGTQSSVGPSLAEEHTIRTGALPSPVALAGDESSRRWQMPGVGDCILTGADARVTVASNDEHGVRLILEQGGISIHAQKRSKESPLIIEANGVQARVVGTILTVEKIVGGANVFVHEGLVQVTAPGQQPSLVAGGQSWPQPLNKPPSWAVESMTTLAGIAVAAHATQPAPQPQVLPTPVKVVPPAPQLQVLPTPVKALQPATEKQHPVVPEKHPSVVTPPPTLTQPAVVTPPPTLTQPAVTAPPSAPVAAPAPTVTTAPVVVPTKEVVVEAPTAPRPALPVHNLGGPHFDLEAEAQAFAQKSPEELTSATATLQKGGPSMRKALAGAYLARAIAEDASDDQKGTASRQLSELLDDQMGAVDMAIKIRRQFIPMVSPADRSVSRLAIMVDLIELNREDEAVTAAADCMKECLPEQRVFALALQPQLLMNDGQIEEARAAARLLQQNPSARTTTAFYFAKRADTLSAAGQFERARTAARLSLQLDPSSIQAPELRRKFP